MKNLLHLVDHVICVMEVVDVLADMAAGVFAQGIKEFGDAKHTCLAVLRWNVSSIHAQLENSHQEQADKTSQEVRLNVRFQRDVNRSCPKVGLGDLERLLDFPKTMVRLDNLRFGQMFCFYGKPLTDRPRLRPIPRSSSHPIT